jgi:AcrR family transcriptional regulator
LVASGLEADQMASDAPSRGIPDETYEALMAATYRALCEHGYDDLTMRDIAAEFEKSRALVHYHYDTKADLLAAVFEWMVDRYEERMLESVGDAEDPRTMLERFVDVALSGPDDPAFDHWAFFTALLEFRSRAHRDERIREALLGSYDRAVGIVRAILEDGIEQGVFREVDAEAAAHFLFLATDAVRVRRITNGEPEAVEQGRTALDQLVLEPLYR